MKYLKVLIFTNCQGHVLKSFFPITFIVNTYHNFNYIYMDYLDDNIKKDLMSCDYFIYQPLSSIYPIYNTDNLKKYLKPTCKTISFPYIFNDAFTPLYKSYKHDISKNGEYATENPYSTVYRNITPIIELKEKGFSLEEILELYNNNQIDFKYKERFDKTIRILQEKEKDTDIKVSQFIIDNYKKYKLFNYHNKGTTDIISCNHPSNILFIYYANQIFKLMDLEPIKYSGPELFGNAMHVFLDMIFLGVHQKVLNVLEINGSIRSPY